MRLLEISRRLYCPFWLSINGDCLCQIWRFIEVATNDTFPCKFIDMNLENKDRGTEDPNEPLSTSTKSQSRRIHFSIQFSLMKERLLYNYICFSFYIQTFH